MSLLECIIGGKKLSPYEKMEQPHLKALRAAVACFTRKPPTLRGSLLMKNGATAVESATRSGCVLHKETSHLRGSLLMKNNAPGGI